MFVDNIIYYKSVVTVVINKSDQINNGVKSLIFLGEV